MHRPATGTLALIAIGTPANGRSSPGWISSAASSAPLRVHLDEGVDAVVEVVDPAQRGAHDLSGRDLPAADQCGELVDRLEHQVSSAHAAAAAYGKWTGHASNCRLHNQLTTYDPVMHRDLPRRSTRFRGSVLVLARRPAGAGFRQHAARALAARRRMPAVGRRGRDVARCAPACSRSRCGRPPRCSARRATLREAIDAGVRAAVEGRAPDAAAVDADRRLARAGRLAPRAGRGHRRQPGAVRARDAPSRRAGRSGWSPTTRRACSASRPSARACASAARTRARRASTTARPPAPAAGARWRCAATRTRAQTFREATCPDLKASSRSTPRSPSPTARAARCATAGSTSRTSSARCRSSRSGDCWWTASSSRGCRPPSRIRWPCGPPTRASTSRPRWRCWRRSGACAPLIDISDEQARDDLARASVMALSFVAQSARGVGRPPVPQREVDRAASIPERFLIRWRGEADPDHVKAIDAYWISAAEHGMNASTFTARVVASTGADVAAALSAAVGALSGPLHGGAPARVLKMLDDVERVGDADALRARRARPRRAADGLRPPRLPRRGPARRACCAGRRRRSARRAPRSPRCSRRRRWPSCAPASPTACSPPTSSSGRRSCSTTRGVPPELFTPLFTLRADGRLVGAHPRAEARGAADPAVRPLRRRGPAQAGARPRLGSQLVRILRQGLAAVLGHEQQVLEPHLAELVVPQPRLDREHVAGDELACVPAMPRPGSSWTSSPTPWPSENWKPSSSCSPGPVRSVRWPADSKTSQTSAVEFLAGDAGPHRLARALEPRAHEDLEAADGLARPRRPRTCASCPPSSPTPRRAATGRSRSAGSPAAGPEPASWP